MILTEKKPGFSQTPVSETTNRCGSILEDAHMRVIITGGTGLIGRLLSSSLTRDRHEVIVLSRSRNATQAACHKV
jgi:FlaA1/EpsC-like NDP-sugar epimerase